MCYAQQDVYIPFEDAYKRVYNVSKLTGIKVTIDGKLDEDIWKDPEGWSENFVQAIPRERLVPDSPTRFKMFYDDKNIYVAFYCKEKEPEKMNRFIGNRDDNGLGDLVAIALDTYHDFRAGVEFNLNLGGNKTDLVILDNLDRNVSWNSVWEGRTHLNVADSSWTAEMRIPFSQLRYNYKSTEGIWGVNVRRNIRHNNEIQKWSLIPRPNNGHVYSFGEIHGFFDLPKPRGYEFSPYIMGKYHMERKIPGSPYQKGHDWGKNVGLDGKITLSDFTLDIAINPDYGQVELDPSVMNLSALETFYEEKRPFFLEGKHLTEFNNDDTRMFYSRRLGATPSYHPRDINNVNSFAETKDNIPIISALKLTGANRKGVSIGIIQSITARSSSGIMRDGEKSSEVVEPFTNYFAARVVKNWKGNTLLGGIITSVNRDLSEPYLKEFLVRNALTAGVDFTQYFRNRLYYVDFKGMFSTLHGSKEAITLLQRRPAHYYQRQSAADYLGVNPDRTSLRGTGGLIKIGRRGNEKWTFAESFSWSSPGFDLNDMGYMKSADVLTNYSEIAYRQKDIWKMFRSNSLTLSQENQWDYGGTLIKSEAAFNWTTMTLNRLQLNVWETVKWSDIENRLLRGGPDVRFNPSFFTAVTFNTDNTRRLMFKVRYENYQNTDGYDSFNKIRPSITWRMGNHIYFSGEFDYTKNTESLQYVATVQPGGGGSDNSHPEYVIGQMDQKTYSLILKLQVNLTPDLSVQFYGSPFTSTAKFKDFKEARETKSHTYEKRFYAFTPNEISYSDNVYTVNRDGVGYSFKNPDFSFNEFRSNLVVRWEYRPGSTLYFVWEHSKSNRDQDYVPRWSKNLDRMFGFPATNVLMVKMNYWFNL